LKTIPIYSLKGKPRKKRIKLPEVFNTPLRPDVIKKTVLSLQSHRYQPQGRDPLAGKRTTAESRGTGLGLSRMPRVKGSLYRKAGQAALAPGTVGGRQPHPPKASKRIYKRLNKKERRLAIRSAIAATAKKEVVLRRGHNALDVPYFPFVVSDSFQRIKKSNEIKDFFEKTGFWSDVERIKNRRIRAGKGSMRGRKKKKGSGPLIVVSKDEGIEKAARNHPGVDIVTVDRLNAEILAPGTHPGRLTIWTESALKSLNNLFH
jgi:large subunit ribosomal protein L4e